MQSSARKSKPAPIMLQVVKGGLQPADNFAVSQLRERGYKVGNVVACQIKKQNNPKFHRLVHRIGQLCAANIEAFEGMDAHAVIKRLQWESNTYCEEVGVSVPGIGMAMMRWPRSLAFDSMDDGERHEMAKQLCRHIASKYWPSLDADRIEEMAEAFVE